MKVFYNVVNIITGLIICACMLAAIGACGSYECDVFNLHQALSYITVTLIAGPIAVILCAYKAEITGCFVAVYFLFVVFLARHKFIRGKGAKKLVKVYKAAGSKSEFFLTIVDRWVDVSRDVLGYDN